MWSSIFGGKKHVTLAHARTPAGVRVYAVGDIHGCIGPFLTLLNMIEEDRRRHAEDEHHLVLLGDLIDRGPNSYAVVERCLSLEKEFDAFNLILGNHEHALLEGLRTRSRLLSQWLQFGGLECAASYGISPSELHGASPREIADKLEHHIPTSHLNSAQNTHE